MLIRDILKKKGNKTITTSKETKIVDIAHILAKENIGAIVILEKEKVIGILSERDVVRGFIQKKSVRNTDVQELMTKNVFLILKLYFLSSSFFSIISISQLTLPYFNKPTLNSLAVRIL